MVKISRLRRVSAYDNEFVLASFLMACWPVWKCLGLGATWAYEKQGMRAECGGPQCSCHSGHALIAQTLPSHHLLRSTRCLLLRITESYCNTISKCRSWPIWRLLVLIHKSQRPYIFQINKFIIAIVKNYLKTCQ